MADQVSKFQLFDNTTIYAHKECSLNPDFDEPQWKQADLLAIEDAPPEITCMVCTKRIAEEPPVYWSTMKTIEEV